MAACDGVGLVGCKHQKMVWTDLVNFSVPSTHPQCASGQRRLYVFLNHFWVPFAFGGGVSSFSRGTIPKFQKVAKKVVGVLHSGNFPSWRNPLHSTYNIFPNNKRVAPVLPSRRLVWLLSDPVTEADSATMSWKWSDDASQWKQGSL